MEDLTTHRIQAHIGRVCIHATKLNYVNELVHLEFEGAVFQVKVLEDNIEIIDFGPCYKHPHEPDTNAVALEDDLSVAESDHISETESFVEELPADPVRKAKRRAAWEALAALGTNDNY